MEDKTVFSVAVLITAGLVGMFLKSALDGAREQLEEERNPRTRWTDANRWD